MTNTLSAEEYRKQTGGDALSAVVVSEQTVRAWLETYPPRCFDCGQLEGERHLAACPCARRSKYGNRKTTVDGIRFDSLAEAKRYGELQLRLAAGEISDLVLQPRYPLMVNGEKVGTYVADFAYLEDGRLVVEDVKGGDATKTPVYRLKRKLVKALHGIEVTEVG